MSDSVNCDLKVERTIQMHPQVSSDQGGNTHKRSETVELGTLNSITILIIDDCEIAREQSRRLLDRQAVYHCTLHEASSGEAAVQILNEIRPDIILLDFMLPDMDALQLLQIIQGRDELQYCARVVITSHGNEQTAVACLQGGAHDYLSKSELSSDVLLRSIGHSLERVKLLRCLHQEQSLLKEALIAAKKASDERNDLLTDVSRELRCALTCLQNIELTNIDSIESRRSDQQSHAQIQTLLTRLLNRVVRNASKLSEIVPIEFSELIPNQSKSLGLRVLVIEDNIINRILVERVLLRMKCNVVAVSSAEEGLVRCRQERFDAVVLDINLPQMSGIDFARQIREQEKDTQNYLPLIALTALALEGDKNRCLEAGIDEYVSKPFHWSDLEQKLRAVCDTKRNSFLVS